MIKPAIILFSILLLSHLGCPVGQSPASDGQPSIGGRFDARRGDELGGGEVGGAANGAPVASDGATRTGYDVIVVGAGSGGVAAAIAATRLGAKVALLEATDWVGGQMTAAAVANMDGGRIAPSGSGLYAEFRQRVLDHYADPTRFPPAGKSIATCYWGAQSTCFEPKVGRMLLEQMLAAANVDLMLTTEVTSVQRSGARVTGVTLADGRQLTSDVLIDATEYGDVIPLAGAAYRVGNQVSGASIDPNACIQSLTYVAVIKRYDQGVPQALKIDAPPPGYGKHLPHFAKIVAKGGSSSLPLQYPVSWAIHSAYRGMPDSTNPSSYTARQPDQISRTGVNWANDHPATVAYLETPAVRRQVECEAKLKTLSFVYYAQTALGQSAWSVADDQGYDTPYNQSRACPNIPAALRPLERHLPPIPYVRESRRIVPVDALTAKQIKRQGSPSVAATRFRSSIAVGDYPTDLHGCGAAADLDLGDTPADNSNSGVFEVPIETLIPEVVDGFVAAEKNIGVSRLANGATRLQPITMATGQAAGTLAALAVKLGVEPRDVSPLEVQRALVGAGSAVSLAHFSDVPIGSAHWAPVQLATVHQLMAGVGNSAFAPDQAATREQGAVVLARLFELGQTPPSTATYQDVAVGRWSHAAVEAVTLAGITGGCQKSPPLFCPDAPLTRGQLAAFLVRGLKLAVTGVSASPTFDDVEASDPMFSYIEVAAKHGLMSGCAVTPQRFCPTAAATRAQLATVIVRALALR